MINYLNSKNINYDYCFSLENGLITANNLIYDICIGKMYNKNNGTILIKPTLKVGIYNLTVSLNDEKQSFTPIKITIKPIIYYKGYSFYFNEVEKTEIIPKVVPEYLLTENVLHYQLEKEIEGIKIDNNTGIISFNNKVDAKNYKLVIITNVKEIEIKSVISFNI